MDNKLANFMLLSVKLVLATAFTITLVTAVSAQSDWTPNILSDGQPDITGLWNNVGATATPLELSDQFQGRVPTQEEVTEFIHARSIHSKRAIWTGF